jgi:hypothetical protein
MGNTMNLNYDFAPGQYFLVVISPEGPSGIEGVKHYGSHAAALKAAETLLRTENHGRITICKVCETAWLDPKPKLMSDLPQCEDPAK